MPFFSNSLFIESGGSFSFLTLTTRATNDDWLQSLSINSQIDIEDPWSLERKSLENSIKNVKIL